MDNIDYNKLFRMLITVYTKPVCIYGYMFNERCNTCNKIINNGDDIYYNGIELSKYEIHDYLYHNIDYTKLIKDTLFNNRDSISYMYYRYLRTL